MPEKKPYILADAIERAVLVIIAEYNVPIDEEIIQFTCSMSLGKKVVDAASSQAVRNLACAGLINEIPGDRLKYTVTHLGHQYLDEVDGHLVARPILATICNGIQLENDDPSTALLCIDEDEVNAWWNSLDVEQKIDAFAQFSLSMYQNGSSHIYVGMIHSNPTVPVEGSIGSEEPTPASEVQA
ncbi:MAG: hypothetical protein P4K83_02245 [Terracidiphilus sp.]|nr:hypothetical protein [Terracidiphilus sp.]